MGKDNLLPTAIQLKRNFNINKTYIYELQYKEQRDALHTRNPFIIVICSMDGCSLLHDKWLQFRFTAGVGKISLRLKMENTLQELPAHHHIQEMEGPHGEQQHENLNPVFIF